jgi:hypothetical protein
MKRSIGEAVEEGIINRHIHQQAEWRKMLMQAAESGIRRRLVLPGLVRSSILTTCYSAHLMNYRFLTKSLITGQPCVNHCFATKAAAGLI